MNCPNCGSPGSRNQHDILEFTCGSRSDPGFCNGIHQDTRLCLILQIGQMKQAKIEFLRSLKEELNLSHINIGRLISLVEGESCATHNPDLIARLEKIIDQKPFSPNDQVGQINALIQGEKQHVQD